MVTFEEAARMLDEAADALPQGIFDQLNGGVNLLPARRTDEDGLLIMGMYFTGQMGRYIEIYYGSFQEAFPDADAEQIRRELEKTLKHELTHHVEGLAWDDSLEQWDAKNREQLLTQLYDAPLHAESLLFVDEADADLAPMADALFRAAAAEANLAVRSASAGLSDPPERADPRAEKAARALGAELSAHVPRRVTPELLQDCDAVLCMTEEQANALAERVPACDGKIMCLGLRDIKPPALALPGAWSRTAARLAEEIDSLTAELQGEDEPGGD